MIPCVNDWRKFRTTTGNRKKIVRGVCGNLSRRMHAWILPKLDRSPISEGRGSDPELRAILRYSNATSRLIDDGMETFNLGMSERLKVPGEETNDAGCKKLIGKT
jgi:hypothetical protein